MIQEVTRDFAVLGSGDLDMHVVDCDVFPSFACSRWSPSGWESVWIIATV